MPTYILGYKSKDMKIWLKEVIILLFLATEATFQKLYLLLGSQYKADKWKQVQCRDKMINSTECVVYDEL